MPCPPSICFALRCVALLCRCFSVKEDYPSDLFSSRLVKPLVAHLALWVKKEWGKQTPVFPTAALLLKVRHFNPIV